MRGLDDTDRTILRLLLDDGRRPYSDIAAEVDLSPPAVSDRVDRLRELGLIRRFTVDLDRSKLREGVSVLVDVDVVPGRTDDVRSSLTEAGSVDHLFATADGRVVFSATVPESDVSGLLADAVALDAVVDFEVDLLADSGWTPGLGDAEFAPPCDECGNTVTSEGESATYDGDRYQFCCGSCRDRFEERFEKLREGARS